MKLLHRCRNSGNLRMSLPVRGAWVEIGIPMRLITTMHGRSPCGERGLKCPLRGVSGCCAVSLPVRGAWVEITIYARRKARQSVAPRAGSVG